MADTPERVNYNAFHDPDESELKVNERNKLSNDKSIFGQKSQSPSESKAIFEKKVVDYQVNEQELAKKIAEASKQYFLAVKDRTLKANRSLSKDENEKMIIKSLIDICNTLNTDTSQPEGTGSTGLINLILRVCLEQRDIINDLSYKIYQLENKK